MINIHSIIHNISMTCADLNNFLTGVREKSWFAGGGVGGGRGGDAYYLFFFYYVKLMNSNYPEVGVPTPYNLISRSAHVSCLTEYMYHIKSKVINYGLARTQRTKERGLHWQEDWHICILSIQSVCLYITPPFFFFLEKIQHT